MRAVFPALTIGSGLALASCSTSGVFACQTTDQCGEGGVCEATGYCSFPDGMCPSGRRYGMFAAAGLAGECVDLEVGSTGSDSGPPATATAPGTGSTSLTTSPVTQGDGSSSSGDIIDPSMPSTGGDGSSSSTGVDVPDGIVAWWRLDDAPEDGVHDAGLNGLDGMCDVCPIQSDGVVGGGYLFTGAEFVEVANDPALWTTTFTIAAWAKPDEITTTHTVVAKPVGADVDNTWEIFVRPLTGGDYQARFGCGFDGGAAFATHAFSTLGEWAHIVGTHDGEICRLYVNGQPEDEVDISAGVPVEYDDSSVYIGADIDLDALDNLFIGEIDDVRIYDYVLTEDEIAALAEG